MESKLTSRYEILMHVRKTHSITKTAEVLAYTPSAISQTIRNYEKQLGVKLFRKTKNGMQEHPNAKQILDCIEEICDNERRISDLATKINNLKHGHIRIGTIQSISYHWLPQILSELSREYPDLTYEVYVDGFEELVKKLENFQLECIFTSEYAAPGYPFIPIAKDELLLVTPRDHELSNKLSVSINSIEGYRFLSSSDGFKYEAGELIRRHGLNVESIFELNEDYLTLKMVEMGFGIAILPKLLISDAPFDVCIRSFNEHYTRMLGIAYHRDEEPSPAVEKLIEFAIKWGNEQKNAHE